MSEDDKNLTEKEVAQQILKNLDGMQTSVAQIVEEVKGLKGKVDGLENLDIKTVIEEFEKLRASHESVIKSIRSSHSGLHISGLGEEKQQFSLLRAMIAIKTNNWDNAGFEKEVMDQAREQLAAKSSHVIGIDSQGGFFVPDQVIPEIITAIYARSVLVSLAGDGQTRVSILDGLFGMPVKIPKFRSGMIAYFIGEEDDYVESAVKVGNVTMTPKKLGILARITNEMQRFSGFGFETLLRNDFIRAAAKKIDWTILYGTGTSNMPRGVFNMINAANLAQEDRNEHPSVQVFDAENSSLWAGGAVTNSQGGELDFDDLMEMQGALEDISIDLDSSFATVGPARYFRRLKQLKILNFSGQTESQPYLVGIPMLTDAKLRDLIGDYGKHTQMVSSGLPGSSLGWTTKSTDEKYGDVAMGNWGEVLFGRWSGIEIEDDAGKGKYFINDETLIKLRMYCDVGIRHEQSIVVCSDAQMKT